MHKARGLFATTALLTSLVSAAQVWTSEQAHLAAAEVKLIDADSVFTDCDWSSLAADITGKNMVLIGEPDHGTKEVAELRNSLIAELQSKHGFDVVLFESGIGELILPDTASALDMTHGLMGPWDTRASLELMDRIRTQHMAYAGFDVQRSGRGFAAVLHEVCEQLGIDTGLYAGLERRFGPVAKSFGLKAHPAMVTGDAAMLMIEYDTFCNELDEALPATRSPQQRLVLRTLRNRADFLAYMSAFVTTRDWNGRWAARDSAMAGNVRWLTDSLFAGRKVIVVAHNYHIARSNPKEKVMGEWLNAHYGDRMFVIGTFTGGGSYADNSGKPVPMAPPDSTALDIKHVIAGLPGFVNYLRVPTEGSTSAPWMHEPLIVNDTFIDLSNSNELVPARHFDGLLLMRSVSLPTFLEP